MTEESKDRCGITKHIVSSFTCQVRKQSTLKTFSELFTEYEKVRMVYVLENK